MSESAAADDKAKVEAKGAMYHCDYCRKDISQLVRIKCSECDDFDLCLECFATGAHVAPHQPTHDYRVVNNVKTPLWAEDWGADEELLLLEALEMFGMGNWSDVADHVGTKNKTQCETHYADVYCSNQQLLPDPAKALTQRHSKQEGGGDTAMTDVFVKNEGKDADSKRAGGSSASVSTVGVSSSASSKPNALAKAHAVTKPKPKSGLGHLVGYTPNRGDFDTEWENDAELTLADMEFKEEDTKWERDLKLKVIEIYNTKLDGRAERKKFILERGLLDRKEKKRSKEEREVHNNMRVFARFQTAEEHEAFIQGLINEQRLRKRIEQLQQYRLNGIRTLADGELFEAEKRKRDAMLGGKKGSFDAGGSGAAGKLAGKKRAAADAAMDEERLAKARKDTGGKTASSASGGGGSSGNPEWDTSKMPGHELLSSQERVLCSTLQLLPQHYLMIKERLIRECFTRGFLKENQAKQLIKIDVNKTAKIFDFFVSVGWLNTHDLIHANAKQQQQQQAGGAVAAAAAAAAAPAGPAGLMGGKKAASRPATAAGAGGPGAFPPPSSAVAAYPSSGAAAAAPGPYPTPQQQQHQQQQQQQQQQMLRQQQQQQQSMPMRM